MGKNFKGVYNLYNKSLLLFQPSKQKLQNEVVTIDDIHSPELDGYVGESFANQLREDEELITGRVPHL